jgi:Flp pilus assembly protein TadG
MLNWKSNLKIILANFGKRRPRALRRGSAAVELAVVMPMLMTMLFGIWEVGRMADAQQILDNAVHEGSRQAAAGQLAAADVQATVTNYVKTAGLSTTNLTVTVSDLTTPGTDPVDATHLDRMQVTAVIPFKDVRYSTTRFFTSTSTNLTSTSIWYSTNQQSYPSTITAPAGY